MPQQSICSRGKACYPDGAAVISAFSYGNPAMWYCVIINVGIATAFLGAGYFLFNHMSRPLLKL
ncbi:hypothetical protein BC831DRAFT_516063 [Entophlyctis helioformis]|nr:hypothetical protein BC831DRAFT_516063 [Entophlyctis helioformis]